ncbi:hypothetical protein [Photobacterium ganghwense]|uniref:hypothetical protein n=1 Tax=Photobacterium ganghwense TaxID=320778 RepID=UPI001A907F17|nr:hypothetical protein [Photobacterium ganghwense]QSV17532.1 hypothetical protein FH974_25845 [Photobacterium ganghwense]
MNIVSFDEVKTYVQANYKHSRLYGRTELNGWHDDYGDKIVQEYFKTLNAETGHNRCIISRHEHISGNSIGFGFEDVVKAVYASLTPAQLVIEKNAVHKKLLSLDVSSAKLNACPTLKRSFAALNVRITIMHRYLLTKLEPDNSPHVGGCADLIGGDLC